MPVSLPSTGVSIRPGGVSLVPTTLDIPTQGVARLGGLSITGNNSSSPPVAPFNTFNFSVATSSMYAPLFGGFA